MSDSYFIKEGYRINQAVETMDSISGVDYWSKNRIKDAYYCQFPVYQYLMAFMRKNRLKSIVDLGCGVGPKLHYLQNKVPDIDITGVDQKAAIDYCMKTYKFGTWLVDDFENPEKLGLIDSPDIIVSSDVIEHLYDPDSLLDYIRAIARPETYILLSTPERDLFRGENCMESPQNVHVREWNKGELACYVVHRGFNIIEHFVVPPFKLSLRPGLLIHELIRIKNFAPRKNNQVLLMKLDK